jgi:mRNA interferase MazF
MSQKIIKRGEIYWADFTEEVEEKKTRKDQLSQVRKKAAQKDRPVVVISNNQQNQYSEEVIVALISSQLDKVYYFEPEITLKKPSKILTDQILTIDKERLGEKITALNTTEIIKLEKALHLVLNLRNWCQSGWLIFTPETRRLLSLLTQQEKISVNHLLEKAIKSYAKQKQSGNKK